MKFFLEKTVGGVRRDENKIRLWKDKMICAKQVNI